MRRRPEKRKTIMGLDTRIAFWGTVFGGLSLLMAIIAYVSPLQIDLFSRKTVIEPFNPSADSYNILILPFEPLENCKTQETNFGY